MQPYLVIDQLPRRSESVEIGTIRQEVIESTRIRLGIPDDDHDLLRKFGLELDHFVITELDIFTIRGGMRLTVAADINDAEFERYMARLGQWIQQWVETHCRLLLV